MTRGKQTFTVSFDCVLFYVQNMFYYLLCCEAMVVVLRETFNCDVFVRKKPINFALCHCHV